MSENIIQRVHCGVETSPGTAVGPAQWPAKRRVILRQIEVKIHLDVTPEQEGAYYNLSTEARLALGAQVRAWLDTAVQAEQG